MWQPGAGEPYRADVAFDVLDDDPLAAACAEPGWPGASRIREVGDGRLLGSARRIDVAGRLVAPAFAASVRGLDARSWLTPEALAAVGRLGVARLRWHVAPADRPEAMAHAGRLTAPGRPSLEVVDADAPASLLEIASAARGAVVPRVESALDALSRGRGGPGPPAGLWPCSSASWPGPTRAPPARSWPRTRAPRSSSCARARSVALDASSVDLEAVFIDGREPGGRGRRMGLWTDPQIPELGPNVQRAHGRFAAGAGPLHDGHPRLARRGGVPGHPEDGADRRPPHLQLGLPDRALGEARHADGGRFVGKHTLFRGPLGVFMRWLAACRWTARPRPASSRRPRGS